MNFLFLHHYFYVPFVEINVNVGKEKIDKKKFNAEIFILLK